MPVLGINAFHGDSSAALLSDGKFVCAIEEERLNRIKHWAGLPLLAAAECLRNTDFADVTHIAVSRNPKAHLWHKAARAILRPLAWRRFGERGQNSIRVFRIKDELVAAGLPISRNARLHLVEHHHAHMASAFFVSPFDKAAVVSVDGFGDFTSVMWGVGEDSRLRPLGKVTFPHSLGIFYTAFTQLLGFPKYGDEYKMMGLAAYGEPRFVKQVRNIVKTNGGQCHLDLSYFTHHTLGVEMTWDGGEPALSPVYSRKMVAEFGQPRVPRTEILQQHADLAASVQTVLEENYFALLNFVQKHTGMKKLCLAGGVALNCAANGKIFEKTAFEDVYIQPASHDAGTSIGAALYVNHQVHRQPRSFEMRHVYLGPEYSDSDIRQAIDSNDVVFDQMSEDSLVLSTAQEIAAGKIVGWFQGRMEFGPRALGNRSILADPRRKEMKDTLNKRIKYREPFRPFCPSILAEATGDYFETDYPSRFMVQAYRIKSEQRSNIPAVTHEDGTGRLQTVDKDANPLYWRLIKSFSEITGVPVLLNTSFNENEPIVNTPSEALDCFLRTQMDVLVIGSYVLRKVGKNVDRASRKRAFAIE
jgi:carbamoyltransferase